MEEASINAPRLQSTGCVLYNEMENETTISRECIFVFDVDMEGLRPPTPMDGEVEGFTLCSVEEVVEMMEKHQMKRNVVFVMVDFLVRKGLLNADNTHSFGEVCKRLRDGV